MSPPQNSRLAAFVALVVFAGAAALILVPLSGLVLLPLARTGQLPQEFSPASALGLVGLSVGTVILLGATLHRRVHTRFTEQGLLVPGLAGSRLLAWSEFTRVSGKGLQVRLHTARTTVLVNVLCYASPSAVMDYLAAKLPEQVAPGQGAT